MKKYEKKILTFLIVSLLIVIGSFTVLFINFRKQSSYQGVIKKIERNLIQTDSLANNLLRLESDKRGYQLTSDSDYLENFYQLKPAIRKNIDQLEKNTDDPGLSRIIINIESISRKRMMGLDSGLLVFNTRGLTDATALMQQKEAKSARELLNQQLTLLKGSYLKQLQNSSEGISSRTSRNITGLLILLVLFIILMISAAISFRKAQQRLIKNHMKFKEAQRIAKIGSWEWEISTGKLKWSQEQFRIFGEERGKFELKIENYLSHLSEDERRKTVFAIQDALEGKTPFSMEHEVIKKDGSKVTVFEQGTVIFDAEGKPATMFGTTQDVSERKKADTALLEAQEKFRAIFEKSADGIYQSTFDGRFIMVNPAMAKIFGYESPEEMLRLISDIGRQLYVNEADRQHLSGLLATRNHIEDYELQVRKKNGKLIWVSLNIRVAEDNKTGLGYFEGILEDITNRKKYEEELLNLSSRLQLALAATSLGIWDWDLGTNNTVWDDEMYRIYDVNPKNITLTVSEAWAAAVHPDDLDRVNEELRMAIAGEKDFETEFRVIWSDKSIHYVTGNALVVRDQSGKPVRLIGTNSDITERKEAEEEILQLNKSLEQFANITAHDLQEPIRMVSGFLGLLDKKYSNIIDEQGKSYIYRAKDGADRMSILIKDLLEFSRSGNKAAKKEPVDLKSVLELVNRDMSIVIEDTHAGVHIPPALPVVTGTESALYRLFLNLVSNGIKFRKKDTVPEVTIGMQETDESWEFVVQDNGIGVEEKNLPRLFQPFQRLHRKEDYPGTGLGLVTCKKIVETHGGKIWLTSEYGKGTGIHFTLPKMRA